MVNDRISDDYVTFSIFNRLRLPSAKECPDVVFMSIFTFTPWRAIFLVKPASKNVKIMKTNSISLDAIASLELGHDCMIQSHITRPRGLTDAIIEMLEESYVTMQLIFYIFKSDKL